jgi:hypothetical protein
MNHCECQIPVKLNRFHLNIYDLTHARFIFLLPIITPVPVKIRMTKSRMRWAGHVARMGDRRNAYSVFVGKPEGRRPLGRPRCRWVDNIKIGLREIG